MTIFSQNGIIEFVQYPENRKVIYDTLLKNNYAKNYGGAVCARGEGGSVSPQFHNCTFTLNSAANGGAIYINGEKSLLNVKNDYLNCTFNENWSTNTGGAISFSGGVSTSGYRDTIDFIGCTFNGNRSGININAAGGGGIRFGFNINLKILDCNFFGNRANQGGAIQGSSNATYFTIENSNFIENSCLYAGAAVNLSNYNESDTLHLSILNCFFGLNSSNENWLLYLVSIAPYVGSTTLRGNLLDSNPNNIKIDRFALNIIDECIFNNNGSSIHSPFIISDCNSNIITNSVFSENKGFFTHQKDVSIFDTISNCTFYNNHSVTPANAPLYGNTFITNSIFHQELEGNAFPFLAQNVTIENSLITAAECDLLPANVTCGTGNMFGLEPVFADAANGDFHLLPTSPGINAGSNEVVNSLGIASDIEGNSRIQFCTVDMGAYEASDYALVIASYVSQPSCSGQSEGSVQFELRNGCQPYFYTWSRGSETGTGTNDLMPGSYYFTITDALGKTLETNIIIPGLPLVAATTTATPYNCATANSGSASVIALSGTFPFEYLWDNGATTPILSGLTPGVYTVTVSDANGCTSATPVNIGTTGHLLLSITVNPIRCHDTHDGKAAITPLNGTSPFAWLWQQGQTDSLLTGMSGGSYSVTVTDALGCTDDLQFIISAPSQLMPVATATPVSCFGGNDGTASASASGGTPAYTWKWSNGKTQPNITGLAPAWYTVTVTDKNLCTDTVGMAVTSPPQLTTTVGATPLLCFGQMNGTAAAVANGGTPPYSFLWNNGQTDSLLTGLLPGSYFVTVTDANGCTKSAGTNITANTAIQVLTDTILPASTPDVADGAVIVQQVTGGQQPYAYLWSNGTTGQSLTGVLPGSYSLTVTDGAGCHNVFSFTVDVQVGTRQAVPASFSAVILPNPSGRSQVTLLQVEAGAAQVLEARIYDASGRNFSTEKFNVLPGLTTYQLPGGLAPGVYLVLVRSSKGEIMALRWVVV